MTRVVWKAGKALSLRLKDGSYVLAQLLKEPYMVFFKAFSETDTWSPNAAEDAEPLFFKAVTRQFLRYSPLKPLRHVQARAFRTMPCHWIDPFHGSMRVTVWPGTQRERQFIILSDHLGGRLIETHIDWSGFHDLIVIMPSIPLDDDATIDNHEMTYLGTYPSLNERLWICKTLGRNLDPIKDLTFGRPMRDEYATYLDMRAQHGTMDDWGYPAG